MKFFSIVFHKINEQNTLQNAKSIWQNMLRPDVPKEHADIFTSEVDAAWARNPRYGARMLSLASCLFLLAATLWAAFATIDEVTHAEGKIISAQRTQSIQNLEGGILRELLVHEGDIVEKNALLARLDNELAESSYRDAATKALEHSIAIVRLEAERDGIALVFPQELAQHKDIVDAQTAIYNSRITQFRSEQSMLSSQYAQRIKEVDEQLAQKKQIEASLALAVEKRKITLPLVQRKIFSRVDFLGIEQQVVQLTGELNTISASIPKTQAAAQEAKERMSFRNAEIKTAIANEISERHAELKSLQENLAAGGDRVTRTELRSPVRGTVKRIYLHTVGGVVKSGEAILDIVPLDDSLLVEARVRPADVAFLHQHQKALIKLSAYDFSIYGGLESKVEHISADTVEDKHGEFYYIVTLRTQKTALEYGGEALPIIPGMMATADILTGEKTVLDYILKPIIKTKQNALRER